MAHNDERGAPVTAQSKVARKMRAKDGIRSILFIRHGKTRRNNDNESVDRLRGWDDIELTAEGRKEAEQIAPSVAKNNPEAVLCSDLCRAEETAQIICKESSTKCEKSTKDFRPWHVGKFAGMKAKEAVPELCKYAEEIPDTPVPEGESFNTFRNRFFNGLKKALDTHDGLIAIVSHHRCERLLKAWIAGGHKSDLSVDATEFKKKGEQTGHCEIIDIPMKRLKDATSH